QVDQIDRAAGTSHEPVGYAAIPPFVNDPSPDLLEESLGTQSGAPEEAGEEAPVGEGEPDDHRLPLDRVIGDEDHRPVGPTQAEAAVGAVVAVVPQDEDHPLRDPDWPAGIGVGALATLLHHPVVLPAEVLGPQLGLDRPPRPLGIVPDDDPWIDDPSG